MFYRFGNRAKIRERTKGNNDVLPSCFLQDSLDCCIYGRLCLNRHIFTAVFPHHQGQRLPRKRAGRVRKCDCMNGSSKGSHNGRNVPVIFIFKNAHDQDQTFPGKAAFQSFSQTARGCGVVGAVHEKERFLRLRDIIFFYTPTVIKEFSSEKNPWGGPLPRTFRST